MAIAGSRACSGRRVTPCASVDSISLVSATIFSHRRWIGHAGKCEEFGPLSGRNLDSGTNAHYFEVSSGDQYSETEQKQKKAHHCTARSEI